MKTMNEHQSKMMIFRLNLADRKKKNTMSGSGNNR